MLIFRILCAILMAWAVNWALSRPEAEPLLVEVPEMTVIGPIAAAIVGFVNLAVRQGWGFIVGFANGIWAGILSILLSGAMAVADEMQYLYRTDVIADFDQFMIHFDEVIEPLLEQVVNLPLLIVSLGATAIIGVLTEAIHWVLVRIRADGDEADGDRA